MPWRGRDLIGCKCKLRALQGTVLLIARGVRHADVEGLEFSAFLFCRAPGSGARAKKFRLGLARIRMLPEMQGTKLFRLHIEVTPKDSAEIV